MSSIKETLYSLVSVTVPLGFDIVRTTSVNNTTIFEGVRDDRRIIMKAWAKEPCTEFSGQFGMPNLKILKGYIDTFTKISQAEKKGIKIDVQKNNKNDPAIPTDIQFCITGQTTALYRLMKDNLPQQPSMKDGIKWEVVMDGLSKQKITEMQSFSSIMAELDKNFSVKVIDKQLRFFIGEETSSISKVNFTVAEIEDDIKLSPVVFWNCSDFLSIMNLFHMVSSTIKISNMGIIQILVDTDVMKYEFTLPGFKK